MALELLQDHLVEPGQPLDVVGVVGFVGSVGLLEVPLLSLFEELLCFSPTRVRPIQPYRYRYGLSESYRYLYRYRYGLVESYPNRYQYERKNLF